MRNAAFIAALGLASIGIGTALALTTPTQLRTARDGQLAELSQPKIITYPGQANLTGGADTYELVYSPQYLAVIKANERARLKQFEQPAVSLASYDPPPDPVPDLAPVLAPVPAPVSAPDPAQRISHNDDAANKPSAPKVAIRRGATSAEPTPLEAPELAEADEPA